MRQNDLKFANSYSGHFVNFYKSIENNALVYFRYLHNLFNNRFYVKLPVKPSVKSVMCPEIHIPNTPCIYDSQCQELTKGTRPSRQIKQVNRYTRVNVRSLKKGVSQLEGVCPKTGESRGCGVQEIEGSHTSKNYLIGNELFQNILLANHII